MEEFQNNEQYRTPERSLDMGRGCEFCGCGTESSGAHVCNSCFKLHVSDWLNDYPDNLPDDIFEVRFKNTRRSYYRNVNDLPLKVGDIVAVEASPGHDIGIVSLSGDMVSRQMRRVGFNPQNGEFKKIYRKAKPHDIDKWQEAIALEHHTMIRSRQIAADMGLNMKIGDVEYQGDKVKAIFYYIADERVDFRELIKVFAQEFGIRVEMKQIGARQEAGRIGGLGSCGRELCCASWISSFSSVTTGAARAQDISLNPQKLAGQCSKLKCCLIYEYDDYMDARREFPRVNSPLQTLDADYHFIKQDILGRTMSFSTQPGSMINMVTLSVERVREIMKMNARGVKPDTIETERKVSRKESDPGFVNVIGEESITRFDSAKRGNKKKKNRGGGENGERNASRDGNRQGGNAKAGERQGGGRPGDQRQGNREGGQKESANRQQQGNNANRGNRNDRNHGGQNKGGQGKDVQHREGQNRGKVNRPSGEPPKSE